MDKSILFLFSIILCASFVTSQKISEKSVYGRIFFLMSEGSKQRKKKVFSNYKEKKQTKTTTTTVPTTPTTSTGCILNSYLIY